MAAVMASRFISTSLNTKFGTAFESEPRVFQNIRIPYLRNGTAAYHGLRSQNMVDSVQMRTNAKGSSWRGRSRWSHSPAAVVLCGIGMNIVFVGVEMAPWSKTGGLGDVLGGLPPAMAVSICFVLC